MSERTELPSTGRGEEYRPYDYEACRLSLEPPFVRVRKLVVLLACSKGAHV